ncbi:MULTISPECIES: hypothetical protein [Bacillus cereus group]|uniref:hypothetical protein n=1 Tax=Bacillus cereus group TaxID=86661 RepID=UPI000AC81D18|nr:MULTISPECIES: hypothetical protein [Bacillus cereus group]MDG1621889.1 hypothetical protein [Bacillus mobilis]MDX5838019.1 hypothetical protein [Bacillus cereus group sp. BfR-BA-01700]HDR7243850.1 hypothetical protein [Bacillus mobilis]
MVDGYSIEIKDTEDKSYLLCFFVCNEVLTFAIYEEAYDYNYEFEDTLFEGIIISVI